MSGNLISNRELEELISRGLIDIKPFERERAQLAHYPLDPELIRVFEKNRWVEKHSFGYSTDPFVFEPGQYVLVEIRQHISVSDGIIGQFIPASNLIEQGFSLTAGKISFPFGHKNERIRFGLRNNLAIPRDLKAGDLVAYVQFFDLIESKRNPYALSDRDVTLFSKRRQIASDSGPFYDEDPDSPV